MQNGLVSQSDGPPSVRSAPFSARSLSVVEPDLLGRLVGHHEGVGVHGVGRLEGGELLLVEVGLELLDRLVDVRGGLALVLVEELEHRRGVLRREVDLALVEGLDLDVAEAAEGLDAHLVALGFEALLVDLGEDGALAEVLRADDDGRVVAAVVLGGVVRRVAAVVVVAAGGSDEGQRRQQRQQQSEGLATWGGSFR